MFVFTHVCTQVMFHYIIILLSFYFLLILQMCTKCVILETYDLCAFYIPLPPNMDAGSVSKDQQVLVIKEAFLQVI